jgi:hypothetical protein
VSARQLVLGLAGLLFCARVASSQTPSAATPPLTETDKQVKLGRLLGTPGGTSPVDLSRPGFDTILESTGNDTDVAVRVGIKSKDWLFDATLKSDVDKNDSVTAVAAAEREPLSSSGSFSLGATYASGLEFESDAFKMLALCKGQPPPCATNNKDLPDDVREKLRSMIKFKAAKTYGAKLTITRPSFKYRLTPDGADVEDERHTGIAVTGGAGYLWDTTYYLGVSVGGERTWNAAADDPVTFCKPNADVGAVLDCVDTILGEPVKKSGVVAAAVFRYFASNFIIAPRFEYRETKDLKTLDIPIYFVPESDGPKLTGGVMYRLKNGESRIFAFVGTAVPAFGLPFK